jgi:hypothetical protein
MRVLSGSRPLVFGLILFVPLLTGASGNGCGSAVVIGNDTGGGGTVHGTTTGGIAGSPTSSGTSTTSSSTSSSGSVCDCGTPPPGPLCPSGEAASPVCEVKSNQTCGWVIPPCAPVVCNCPNLPDIVQQCPDGSTVQPECVVTGNTCEVIFPSCPPDPCPASACGTPPPGPLCPGGIPATIVCVPTGAMNVCGWEILPCPPMKTCMPSDCGAMPTIEVECNGSVLGPLCEPDAQNNCGWVIPPCVPGGILDGGVDVDGSACPQPHPQPCNAIIGCKCLDGTEQEGGCLNGFTCPEACCGHGGSM